MLYSGDDAEVGNSKWTVAGDPKRWKRNRIFKEKLALSHEKSRGDRGDITESEARSRE